MPVELSKTPYNDYPDMFKVAVPVGEVAISPSLEFELPAGTTHIMHTVYVGRQNHEVEGESLRNFWEQRDSSTHPCEVTASMAGYQEILAEHRIPGQPNQWMPGEFIYVENIGTLAVVEFPTRRNMPQSRVTAVRTMQPPQTGEYAVVKTRDEYANRLEALGVPSGAFNHLRNRSGGLEEKTTPLTQVFSLPGLRQLYKAIEWGVVGPTMDMPYLAIPPRSLVHSVRTENFIGK